MKKFALFLLTALLLPLQACADDVKWEEGKHYEVLDQPATSKPTVYEFASFWCGHCYRFEPVVAQIKEALPENVKFTKIHVNFMPGADQNLRRAETPGGGECASWLDITHQGGKVELHAQAA